MLRPTDPQNRFYTASGNEDQFRPPSLSGGCGLGLETFAGTRGNEEEAPSTAVGECTIEPPELGPNCDIGRASWGVRYLIRQRTFGP